MANDDPKFDGNYTIRLARNFIFMSYKTAGVEYAVESFERSPLADQFGPVPAGWNEGLFRYLDESINLINTAEYCLLTALLMRKDEKKLTLVILAYQLKSSATAVRALSHLGLDSQARITLRALYENSIGFCRALVDEEFRERFREVKNPEEANQFWHKYLSKSKSERHLIEYNSSSEKKCFLVLGDTFKEIYRTLGISAHPNYLFSQMEYLSFFSEKSKSDGFLAGSEAATEFVLASASHIILCVVGFLASFSTEICEDTPWIIKKNAFDKLGTNSNVLGVLGKISNLMNLMLMKWTNRQRSDFNPEKHF